MDDDRLSIGSWLSLIYREYGLDAAESLADNLHGLSWNMRITHGDVERYLDRKYYLNWMGFEK